MTSSDLYTVYVEPDEKGATTAPLPLAASTAGAATEPLEEYFTTHTSLPPPPPPTTATATYDWNDEWQTCLELTNTDERTARLTRLSTDFFTLAQTLGRVIISELALPDKTIPPVALGGKAGGLKYISHGILFKVADDVQLAPCGRYVYGGGDGRCVEFAQKAAAHDLKGAMGYNSYAYHARRGMARDQPRVPMQCIADYLGFRLLCMPMLPLQALVYGSENGGESVACGDEHAAEWMRLAGECLHVAPHYIRGGHLMYSAGDVEMHVGTDGRRYVLDLARTYPPEDAAMCTHLQARGHPVFYRLFRPEYLKIMRVRGMPPLSADSGSGWCAGQSDTREHHERTAAATRYLLGTVITDFCQRVNNDASVLGAWPVSESVHREGINIRHIGLVRHKCHHVDARRVLLVECVSRTLKNLLRRWLRHFLVHNFPSYFEVKSRVACFLNLVSGAHASSGDFWRRTVTDGVCERFGECTFTDDERVDVFATVSTSAAAAMFDVLVYVVDMMGISLTAKCRDDFDTHTRRRGHSGFTFTASDFDRIDVTVQYMSVVDSCRGQLMVAEAHRAAASATNRQAATRLLELAELSFSQSLRSDPQNVELVVQCMLAPPSRCEVAGRFAEADRLTLALVVEQNTRGSMDADRMTTVTNMVMEWLAVTWASRAARGWYPDRGGASSVAALHEARAVAKETVRDVSVSARIESMVKQREVTLAAAMRALTVAMHEVAVDERTEVLVLAGDTEAKMLVRFLKAMNRRTSPDRGGELVADDRHNRVVAVYQSAFGGYHLSEKVRGRFWERALAKVIGDGASGDGGVLGVLMDLDPMSLTDRLMWIHTCIDSHDDARDAERAFAASMCRALVAHKIIYDRLVLHWAAGQDAHHVLRIVLAHPGEVVDVTGRLGETSLYWAAKRGHDASVRVLLECGADPNLRDYKQKTALQIAAYYDKRSTVQLLLDAKAHVDLKNDYGWTALAKAAQGGNTELVQMLVARGADVNASNARGETPIFAAIQLRVNDAVATLLKAKADLSVKDNWSGRTPLEWASGQADIVAMIQRQLQQQQQQSQQQKGGANVAAADGGGDDGDARFTQLLDQNSPAPSSCCVVS